MRNRSPFWLSLVALSIGSGCASSGSPAAAEWAIGGQSLAEAANAAAPFNSGGMYRALADSRGRFDVRIFED